ncbi:probable L-gulonolactone oxidase 6 [Solanum tuberosum]|uniref:L-gulonolactone oxidase n=2 Tax=Solanum tuberosum TaxID=4113 RepID=M1C7U8_SOLTU|nr:PREDICTED: probable L-gulonolactone oxidase 6 [Solanum tuberosum]
MSDTKIIKLSLIFFMIYLVNSSPPEDPIKCSYDTNFNCTITNTYGAFPDRTICKAAQAVFPTTEEEVISIVANATREKRKMKITTRFSSSIPKLVCLDNGDQDGLLISTKFLNKIIKIDQENMMITVESGVTLRQLISEAGKAGLVLPYTPYWWGLTIGGLIGTGAHGSSLWGLGSSVHDYIVQLRIVTPADAANNYAKVRILENGSPDLNAVRVSLGVLGVVSQVTLKLERVFKRSITFSERDDSNLGEDAATFGRQHEFADFTWYPSQHKVIYRIDDRVSIDTPGNALNDFLGFRPTDQYLLASLRTLEEILESTNNADGKCLDATKTTGILKSLSYGWTNNGTGYPMVGFHDRVQASGTCLDSHEGATCPWDHRVKGLFFHQTTFTISLSKVKGFIEDVQRLVALEPKALCVLDLYNGILMRYVTTSNAYLGKQEDSLDFDITYYRSKDPMSPRLFEDFLEEIEQLAFFKYGALPHWGKNRNVAFIGAINKYKNVDKFLQVKQSYDHFGLFSSEWTDQVLGLKDGLSIVKEGCALEGLCICSKDIHCAPNKGYFCRPGRIYKDARVCTNSSLSTIDIQTRKTISTSM